MFTLNPAPKPSHNKSDKPNKINHNRNKPKRGNNTKFSQKTRRLIIARDGGLCVRCKRVYHNIHHITLASAGGAGEAGNGVAVCVECHLWAHSGREGRRWFEDYRDKYLRERDVG